MKQKITFLFILLIVILAVGGGLVLNYINNTSTTTNNEIVVFEINKGSSAYSVGEKLKEEGLIKDENVFKYQLKLNSEYSNFQAGKYTINKNETLEGLIKRFSSGDSIPNETVKVTFPEGLTTKEMLSLIEKELFLNPTEIMEYAHSNGSKYWFLNEVPTDNTYLDGVLFPDTYEFSGEANVEEVITKMLDNTEKKLEPFKEKMVNHELSVRELLTLSSLIEKEARHDQDRPMISGIIYNRLADNMLLQIDATVLAVIGHKNTVTYEDLKVDSPYNTYKYKGLPPSPIAMPGVSSIEAALNPIQHTYLFYVADRETGFHHFAETFKEHEENIEKYWKKK